MKRTLFLLAVLFLASKATLAQVPSYVPSNGLVGWWPFNGNANDKSGNGNHGVVTGATLTSDRSWNANSAYSFNGISNHIEIPSLSNFQYKPVTYSVWINPTVLNTISFALGGGLVLMGREKATYGNEGALMIFDYPAAGINNDLGYYIGASSSQFSVIPNINQWNLVTMTLDLNDSIACYYNGNLVSKKYYPTSSGANIPFKFGAGTDVNGVNDRFNFNGSLDDIGIWNRALDSCEVKDLYYASLGNCCSAAFNTQPQSVNTTTGSNASFVAQSTSLNAIYQWQTNLGLGWQNLSNAGQYNGVTNDTLIVSNLTSINNQQLFRCVLTSGNCSDTSSQAVLNVCDGFATQPSSMNAVVAQNASFVISSLVNNPIYQWQSDLGLGWQNLSNAGQYSGVNNDTLVVTNLSAANNNQLFRCILMSGTCSDTSAAATLSVSQTNGLNTLQNEIISIYPNPATNQINIVSNAAHYPLSYKVYNELGQALLIGDLKTTTTSIDISSLAPGNYMLVVGTKHVSFVKNK